MVGYCVVLLFPALCHAQELEKGNLLGLHVVTVTLNHNVTMDDFTNAFVREVLPESMSTARQMNWKEPRWRK
jgi:hypothetical protein